MTIYSYFLVSGAGEPEFHATGHDCDDDALAYGEGILRRDGALRVVEVWDGPLRLAHLRREGRSGEPRSWRDVLEP